MKDADYMRLAIAEAKKAAYMGEVPVGAVIIDKDGEIIATAHNLRETLNDPTAHAEILAIRNAGEKLRKWRLEDLMIYVTLEPCPMCAGAILESRIGRLVYGAMDIRRGGVESIFALLWHKEISSNTEIRAGVLEDECKELLKKFFTEKR
ncbi:MAG: tRNA adenosine(34) deaminase TadA [Selenomonadaceae bacterium]|nr:tRNA adenosine(34) deaminase TadA [Selenomonadaceae bacterium]